MDSGRNALYKLGYKHGQEAARGKPGDPPPDLWEDKDFSMGYEDGAGDEHAGHEAPSEPGALDTDRQGKNANDPPGSGSPSDRTA